jgi:hypothetical protein
VRCSGGGGGSGQGRREKEVIDKMVCGGFYEKTIRSNFLFFTSEFSLLHIKIKFRSWT